MTTCNGSNDELGLRCVAHSSSAFDGQVRGRPDELAQPNCFRQSTFTPDGTAIITYNADQRLRTFVLPPDLLTHGDNIPRALTSYSTSTNRRSRAFAVYPGFGLSDTASTLVLHAADDLPIKLVNALDYSYSHAHYPWIKTTTEEYLQPSSLLWTPDGTKFVAGGRARIATFDASRTDGPVTDFSTHKSWRTRHVYGHEPGLSDLITALALNESGVLAAGTTQRQLALFDAAGVGQKITQLDLTHVADATGAGVMQLEWDSSGQYLFMAERQSDQVIVFDMRAARVLSQLIGRKAQSTMRQTFSFGGDEQQLELWAGGIDGKVRVWRHVLSKEGRVPPDAEFAAHQGTVSGVLMHQSRSVLASTSGDRSELDEEEDAHRDISLRVWSLV